MLTLRIHLDSVSEENGPLRVIAGSHRSEEGAPEDERAMQAILCQRGDVLAMRPLLTHSSGNSAPGTLRHRRVLHLEFAASCDLPDGYQWHEFHRPARNAVCQPMAV
jgi:ectoine hydroxylase-related dioxygenase (phytanoyl-CoA dioxygenase family)